LASNDVPFVKAGRRKLFLGWLPPDEQKRAAMQAFGDAVPKMPRSEWRKVNRRKRFSYVTNQRSHGSCTGYSSAYALTKALRLSGRKCPILSGSYAYSFVNGGRDQGAQIHELMAVLTGQGLCSEDKNTWDKIYPNQISAEARTEAQRYKAIKVYAAKDFDDLATALQMPDCIPVFAVMVGNRFNTLDKNGVAGFDPGPGNHAVHADGLEQLADGTWLLDNMGSWGNTAGDQGRYLFTEHHINDIGYQDCYVVQVGADDPGDDDKPPEAV
jgi:hypothetical protein